MVSDGRTAATREKDEARQRAQQADASRSIGRALRTLEGEMKGMKDDDVRAEEPRTTLPVRAEAVPRATPTGGTRSAAELGAEARATGRW